jgi:hypothetical protein
MRERGRTGRSIERQLGWSTGYLSQILRDGPPALKVEHVLAILEALEVPPPEFFARLYDLAPVAPAPPAYAPEGHGLGGARAFVRRLVREEGLAQGIDRDEIRRVVSEVVRAELLRFVAGVGEPTPQGPERAGGRRAQGRGAGGRSFLGGEGDGSRREKSGG